MTISTPDAASMPPVARRRAALPGLALVAALAAATASPAVAATPGFAATPDLLGRAGWVADNGLVRAGIGSDAGARVLRYELAGKPLLWNDPAAVGQTGDPAPGGTSMWYYRETGGWRIWPGPQAQWKRRDAPLSQWPPPATIDHGVYRFFGAGDGSVDAHGPAEANPLWRCVGMQLHFSYRLEPAAARLHITSRMTNLSPHPQRWSQWMVAAAPVTERADAAKADTVVWPFRAKAPSRFGPRNYYAQAGDYGDEQWQPDEAARVVRSRCLGRGGKIAGDSDGGWIARQDGEDGTVLAILFPPAAELEARVPEGWSSVATAMLGKHAVEIEAMTPELDLDPGSASVVTWRLAACRLDAPLVAVTDAAAVAEPLRAVRDGAEVRVTGSFGTFARGKASLRVAGNEVASWPCAPTAALRFDQRVAVPAGGEVALVVLPELGAPEPVATVAVP